MRALYQVKFYNQDVGNPLGETNGKLQLEGSLEKGITRLFARVNTDIQNSYQGWSEKTTLYEGFLSVKPSTVPGPGGREKNHEVGEGLCLEPGGLSRPGQEFRTTRTWPWKGFTVVTADYTKSFAGPLKTFSLTPVFLPVVDQVNEDFGGAGIT